MLKTRTWVLLIAAAALLLAVLCWLTLGRRTEGRVAEIVQDGKVLETVDLDQVAEPYRLTVDWPESGSNTVLIQPGRIRVEEADCPDRVCVEQGWLSDGAAPIVCLPHRLVIRIRTETELDAVAK